MQNTLHIVFLWIHILGLVLFLGPQFFLAFAWLPASRGIPDPSIRLAAMRTITSRFGWIGGIGLLLLLIGGLYLIGDWRTYYNIPSDVSFTALRFGVVFIIKMCVLAVMLVLLALHTFAVGPRLLSRMEARSAGQDVSDAEIHTLRMRSMALSISVLLLTLVIMVFGVMLNTTSWSLQ